MWEFYRTGKQCVNMDGIVEKEACTRTLDQCPPKLESMRYITSRSGPQLDLCVPQQIERPTNLA
jgi:hypothetical protein